MRLLVTGDREWIDVYILAKVLYVFEYDHGDIDVLIHGNARGVDRLVANICRIRGIKLESYPANWDEYGKAAGPIRNSQMLREGKPDYVLGFHNNIRESKGTKDMINKAYRKVPTYLYSDKDGCIKIVEAIHE